MQLQVPRIALLTKNNLNSEYSNHSSDGKNVYLSFAIINAENVLYSTNVFNSRDCMDCYWAEDGNELHYECINIYRSYNCQYGIFLQDCTDCLYCYDCRGSSNCFMSSNLRNRQYYFRNQPCSKEEYARKLEELRLDTWSGRQAVYNEFLKLIREKALHKFAQIERCNDVSGSVVYDSRNTFHAFDSSKVEDSKYQVVVLNIKTSMGLYHVGYSELMYECHGIVRSYDVKFTHLSYNNRFLEYCDDCHNSENMFGCVGVKQGQYCILNKRYGEAEYNDLKNRIVEHMKKTGEYGEFFPVELAPVSYNETQAAIYMPLSREEVLARGWKWEDQVPGTFGKETLKPDEIPESIDDVQDSILKEVLACLGCGKNYNIVEPELVFCRRGKIPIPRHCPDCRYKTRLKLRPPRKLWHGRCKCNLANHFHAAAPCPNEFETPYAQDHKEIVYCEQCYNAEVA